MPCGGFQVCKNCENSFKERKENHTRNFENITVYSWGYYEGKLRDGILNLKSGKKKLGLYFSEVLINFWQKTSSVYSKEDFFVIPVPSHKKRIKERGYCQTSVIAKHFADALSLKFSNTLVKRTKNTKHMNSLENIAERKENIKNAFVVNSESFNKHSFNFSKFLIIDDIVTSGSTMCEISNTIQKTFPKVKIYGLTIASGDTW